jgi:malonyl-CoA O-methyltransferase
MIFKHLNQHIRRAFSNSAMHYEVLAGMQYEIGRELLKTLDWTENCQSILDIGMGTGKLTNRMGHFCPGSKIVGVDFADGMVQEAKKKYETLSVVQGNAEALPFGDGSFDAVASNLAYQWVKDLPGAFSEARRVLKKEGKFCATLFGQETLSELFKTLETCAGKDKKEFPLERLPDEKNVRSALIKAGFTNIEVRSEITKTHFDDLTSLLQWLKLIGANQLNRKYYIGPRRLASATQHYEKHHSGRWGIIASFEVIWIKARI